jgi:hypothetical protein
LSSASRLQYCQPCPKGKEPQYHPGPYRNTSAREKPIKFLAQIKTSGILLTGGKNANKSASKKGSQEAWATIRETQQAHKETEKAIKETQKNIGGLNNTLGSLAEHIMTPDLPRKFKKFGFTFDQITTVKYAENVYAEIDALLENGAQAMVVEVKTTLRRADIDDHLLRMEKSANTPTGKAANGSSWGQ